MVGSEKFSGASLANFSANELIEYVDGQLHASNAITNGGADGLIASLDPTKFGTDLDGIATFNPGTDRERSLDIRATMANSRPMARKMVGLDQPRKLFAVVEYGPRYRYSLGDTSLHGLSRLALATTTIAAYHAQVEMSAQFVADSTKPLVVEDSQADPIATLKAYDAFVADVDTHPNTAQNALYNGLDTLINAADGPDESSDVAVVVSDFVGGAERNRSGDVSGFSWESPLRELSMRLDDRLYVARLSTIGHAAVALQQTGSRIDYDQLKSSQDRIARIAAQKQQAIEAALYNTRHAQIDSSNRVPLIAMSDFVFGTPNFE